MATYQELFDLRSNSELRNKIAVAVVIKAQTLIDGASPTVAEITWSNNVLHNPIVKADEILNYVLAANNNATVAQIVGASDSAIQTNVDAAVNSLIAGGA